MSHHIPSTVRSDDPTPTELRTAEAAEGCRPTSHPSTQPADEASERQPAFATRAVRAGLCRDAHHGAVIPPLHLSSNFTFEALGVPRRYDYTRSGNPTRDLLAEALAELEGGAGAVVTSTGMSAVHLVLQLLAPGDLVLAPFDGYGGTHRLLDACARKGLLDVDFVDTSRSDLVDQALARGPALVWLETPSNPLLRITDLERVCRRAKERGALVAVDNTFLSPVLQSPLALGADLVVHSTTKYLNGHSDVVGGAVVAKDAALHEDLAWWANCLGITGAPFDSFLTLRGLRTLHARVRTHQENARAVVELLAKHPAVEKVYWPGLPSHPGHDIATRQQAGYGAMVSFELAATVPGTHESTPPTVPGTQPTVPGTFEDGFENVASTVPGTHPTVPGTTHPTVPGTTHPTVPGTFEAPAPTVPGTHQTTAPDRAVAAFVDGLRHFALAESLGGVESLIAHPATMTHAAMDPAARRRAGIGDRLLRLSVGIEDPADLVADLEAALERAQRAASGSRRAPSETRPAEARLEEVVQCTA